MKRKIFSILFALVLVVALVLVAAPAAADPGAFIGFWQPNTPDSGIVEFSTTYSHSGNYSVHLEAYEAYSPYDANEVYVGDPTGVDSLADLASVSLWYYCPTAGDEVAPLIDVWLDTDGTYTRGLPPTGDDEWLLGMIADVATYDDWVQVTHGDIQWVRATGGMVYGNGSAGLAAALTDLGDCPILAIGIETGGPGTYISSRDGNQIFYVDDLEINGTTYEFEPTAGVSLTGNTPEIVAISATPTSINFGTLYPGESSSVTTITVTNIGTVDVSVDTSIDESGAFFTDNLWLDEGLATAYTTSLTVGGSASTPDAQVVVPPTYPAVGEITGMLIFEATAP